jgi:hypothetical protein
MKITVAEYGGLAAGTSRQPQVVNAELLPYPAREELAGLVAAAKRTEAPEVGPGMARDAMSYTITVEHGGQPTVLRQSDGNLSAEFAALLKWLRRHATKQ